MKYRIVTTPGGKYKCRLSAGWYWTDMFRDLASYEVRLFESVDAAEQAIIDYHERFRSSSGSGDVVREIVLS